MPTFCRHNRLLQNCPICSREQAVEMRPVVSSSRPASTRPPSAGAGSAARTGGSGAAARSSAGTGGSRRAGGLRVRRLARGTEDGYASPLVPGLRSSEEAARLAAEIARAVERLRMLSEQPPAPYAEIADPAGELEERTWLACQVAFLGLPAEGAEPFAALERHRTSWASGEDPRPAPEDVGPRAATSPERAFPAYRAWAARAGGQAAAFMGDPAWTPERRFARVYERLALPGLSRDPRYELLVLLGTLGLYEIAADSLRLGGADEVTVAAKRVFGIGDPLLLERRAAELAAAAEVPVAALDRGLWAWGRNPLGTGRGEPAGDPAGDAEPEQLERVLAVLGLEP